MKTRNRSNIINFVFIFLTTFLSSANAQEETVWDYPVKPGTEEWVKMDYYEKVKISQPPSKFMQEMKTSDLLDLCFYYPFNKTILLFNNPNDGFENVYKYSTVWQEFIERKDAFEFYKKHYALSLEELNKISEDNKRNNERFNQFFLEKLASETLFINGLGLEDKKELMRLTLQRHLDKMHYPNEYSGFVYNSTLSVMIKILESDGNNEGLKLKDFKEATENEKVINPEYDNLIIEYSKKYISK